MAATDHHLEAFATALRQAVAGETATSRLAAVDQVVAALRPLLGQGGEISPPSGRRGRPAIHNLAWLEAQMLNVALEPDGVPDTQAAMIDRLVVRYDMAEKKTPSIPWLKKKVSAFYTRILIRDHESREKFRSSEEIQNTFETENAFVQFCRVRDRCEEKWRKSTSLQQRFESADLYLAAMTAKHFPPSE